MSDFKKKFLIRLALSLGSVLFVIVATLFAGAAFSSHAAAIHTLQTSAAERSAAIQSLATLKQEAARAAAYRPLLENFLPTQDDLVINFKKDVTGFAKKEQVKLTFTFGEPQGGGATQAGSVAFTLSATGPRASILAFVRDIESSRYIVALGPIEFAASGADWKISASGKVFSVPKPPAPGDAPVNDETP